MTSANGTRTIVPTDFCEKHLELLRELDGSGLPAVFTARIADILWTRKHRGGAGPAGYAVAAIERYLEDARHQQTGPHWVDAAEGLERALRLAALIDARGEGIRTRVEAAVAELADAFEAAAQWRGLLDTLALMRAYGIGEAAANADRCEGVARILSTEDATLLAEGFWQEAILLRRRAADTDKLYAAIMATVDLALDQSVAREGDSASAAAHFVEVAIKRLRSMPVAKREGREEGLRARLAELQARIGEEMGSFSASVDITDVWDRAEAKLSGESLPRALALFVLHAAPLHVPKLRRDVEEASRKAPLFHMMPAVLYDSDGKTIKRVPSMMSDNPEEREAALRHQMVQRANLHQDICGRSWVEAGRTVIAREHEVDAAALIALAAQSPFVPNNREYLWAKAFAAAFEGDFTQASHLLVPQLQHALRYALRIRGHNPVVIDRHLQQEDWNLNTMLLGAGRTALTEVIGEDAVFDLAAMLVDRSGTNLRNAIAHGLIDDGGLESGAARYLFIACLRLCVLPLVLSARAQATSDDRSVSGDAAEQGVQPTP
jgi:hypothetical protein